MLEVPSLFSCRSSASSTPTTPKVFVDSSCVRNAGFPDVGVAEVHEAIRMQADLRSHDNTALLAGKDDHQGELCKPDRGAAIGGGCRVVCTVGKPRSSRTLWPP